MLDRTYAAMGLHPPPTFLNAFVFFFFGSTIIIVMHQKWSHSLKSNIRFNKRVLGFRDRTSAAFESLVPRLGRFILQKGKLTFVEQK